MKTGFDFIIKQDTGKGYLLSEIEKRTGIKFPEKFKAFVDDYSMTKRSIVLEKKIDQARGIEVPIEAVLFGPSRHYKNPLYFNYFRDVEDLSDDVQNLSGDDLWLNKGLLVIGYSTVGEKICLGVKGGVQDEIWLVNDDSIVENKFTFLAKDIFEFIGGFVSKR